MSYSKWWKLFLINYSEKEVNITSKIEDRIRVLITGDSLALPRPYNIRTFDPEKDEELGIHFHNTYGYLLQKELSKIYSKTEIINRAQHGQCIGDVYVQLFGHLFYFQPDIIILHVGIVDCWPRKELNGKPKTDIGNFSMYYDKIIELLKKRKQTKLIIIGICPTSKRVEEKYPGTLQQINKYNNILMSGSDQQQIFYIDMEKHIDIDYPNVYLMLDDQHLNRKGNKLICNLIKDILVV
ncbi:SGNH/GDSL hydrolase family protein [Peribacillus butanolivorans]|uniref:SGNH/GDSL hydrolase family protein n=1 Tax=Peribacillus butanolivorans TaxID=421767 RepID=UPI0030C97686